MTFHPPVQHLIQAARFTCPTCGRAAYGIRYTLDRAGNEHTSTLCGQPHEAAPFDHPQAAALGEIATSSTHSIHELAAALDALHYDPPGTTRLSLADALTALPRVSHVAHMDYADITHIARQVRAMHAAAPA